MNVLQKKSCGDFQTKNHS